MTLLLAFSASLLASEAVSEPLLDAVEHVESSGRGAKTPKGDGGKALGPFQWHLVAWKDCSAIRYKAGLTVYPYARAIEPEIARDYARTWLTALKVSLTCKIGRTATPGEIWLAWNLGWSGFAKHNYQWATVPVAKFTKARLVNTLTWGNDLPKALR